MTQLAFDCIPHAAWAPRAGTDPAAGLAGLAAVRYYRFNGPVRLKTFRLCPTVIRWAPELYARPDHIVVSRFEEGGGWKRVAEVNLPVIEPGAWHDIDLGDVVTDHVRVVCDLEHPLPEECHGDFAYAPWNVPFRILEKVEWLGGRLEAGEREPIYRPALRRGEIRPSAPPGMSLACEPDRVRFRSPCFHVAFSLVRPMLLHLAWDVSGKGLVDRSLTSLDSRLQRRFQGRWPADVVSGPWFSGLQEEAACLVWTGEVSVEGNRVIYRNLCGIDGLSLDVAFEVFADGMDVSIDQRVEREMVTPEYEAWRFMWDGEEAITGTLGIPRDPGRAGLVSLPALWSAPGHGTLLVKHLGGDPACLQVDSVREERFGMSGIILGARHDEYGLITVPAGEQRARLSMRTHEMVPKLCKGVRREDLPEGLRRNWATAFVFRPELGGFSNNCMSVICIMCNHAVVDTCAFTPPLDGAPSVLEMARYTTRLSMQGGPGYGEDRDLWLDTDPSLLCSAGRIHQAEPDGKWLCLMRPWIKQAAQRVLDGMDENGLLVCRKLSGNSGSGRWSSNAMDVISFGHYDAYSNALAYRGLRNAAALMHDAGDAEFGRRCSEAADALKGAFRSCFFNPETGWLAGWRSRDGQLHDHCFHFISGMAVCFDLVEGEDARQMMQRLEAKREEIGFRDFHCGLPRNLISIPNCDVPAEQQAKRADGLDRFGLFLNGGVTSIFLEYYMGALAKCGFTETADRMCEHLLESLADNRIVGGIFSGTELFTWAGVPCGYEGIIQWQFRIMLTIAQYRGWVPRFEPEWWPATPTEETM